MVNQDGKEIADIGFTHDDFAALLYKYDYCARYGVQS